MFIEYYYFPEFHSIQKTVCVTTTNSRKMTSTVQVTIVSGMVCAQIHSASNTKWGAQLEEQVVTTPRQRPSFLDNTTHQLILKSSCFSSARDSLTAIRFTLWDQGSYRFIWEINHARLKIYF